MKALTSITILFLFFITTNVIAQENAFSDYEIKAFEFKGRSAKIVIPKKANDERLWIWRARFWGHEPQTDLALLEKGFHVVYVDVAGLFGNNEAVEIWNSFYDYLLKVYNLNTKTVLEGMSRGGLIIYNWAAVNTDKVFCIYADAPVCDIKSWPGGLYNGNVGAAKDWKECLKAYSLNEKSVLTFEGIPINNAVKVAEAKIPVLHVCGGADRVVPYEENTAKLEEKFKAAGGDIKIIVKDEVGHHPHSLKNPKPIVDFILEHAN
ncbi:alpha/beta hydrolase family protein [Aurantibacter crassamenti]|uniref:alpha/beta hydrolase family protein n=1 Tax=Aurantibacter crassamenti TaxID=1837375 RepID=UPI001EED2E70|nr:prolyl oligopeptidase family serine peptidase [Aurantibacter crassamenti]